MQALCAQCFFCLMQNTGMQNELLAASPTKRRELVHQHFERMLQLGSVDDQEETTSSDEDAQH